MLDSLLGEKCDGSDPNDPNAAICLPDCTLCGNGNLDMGEECDPLSSDNIPCNSDCTFSCGDGVIDAGLG